MRPLNVWWLPYMSTSSSAGWPMRSCAQLGFLEIGVDPDFRQRAQRHHALPGLHVIARVDVSARDHAVDLGHDVAVAQVQLGLIQVGLGFVALGFGQLDRRRRPR